MPVSTVGGFKESSNLRIWGRFTNPHLRPTQCHLALPSRVRTPSHQVIMVSNFCFRKGVLYLWCVKVELARFKRDKVTPLWSATSDTNRWPSACRDSLLKWIPAKGSDFDQLLTSLPPPAPFTFLCWNLSTPINGKHKTSDKLCVDPA